MIIPILAGIVTVVVIFLVVVVTRATDFCVKRSGLVAAPAAVAFAQVNDLHRWEAWSPWAKMDPTAKTTYSGAAEGVGASFAWVGNKKIGEGRMTIRETRAGELVRIDLEFFKPFAAKNVAEFTFKPEGGGTAVTWSMSGKNNFMGKAVGLFINCDKMIGEQFEKGLKDLSLAAQAAGKG